MVGDYPDRLAEWSAAVEFDKLAKKRWQDELRQAQENKKPLPPMPLPTASDIAPEKPRLRQHDVTIEQVEHRGVAPRAPSASSPPPALEAEFWA